MQVKVDKWHGRADRLEEKTKQFSVKSDEQKYYKPVFDCDTAKTFERKMNGETITIDTHKANTVNDDIYISDKVKLKRKELHNFDKDITKAYEILGETESVGKPNICVVSPEEMQLNAIASYVPTQNVLNINSSYFSDKDILALQADFACPENRMSTILHELIHWQDANNYRKKFGEINNYFEYCKYLNEIYKPKVEKLIQTGYNIEEDISEYAFKKLTDTRPEFDEVFAEYRVKALLGG